MQIGEYTLRGGGACPEQYDVFLDGCYVAYLRLRNGHFTATLEVPYNGIVRALVFDCETEGAGAFTSEERVPLLQMAINNVNLYLRGSLAETVAELNEDNIKVRRCDKPTFHDSELHTGFVWYWDSELRSWMLVEYQKIDHGDIWLPFKDLPDPEG